MTSIKKVQRLEARYQEIQKKSRPLCRDHEYGIKKSCCETRFNLGLDLYHLRSKISKMTGETEKQVFKRLGGGIV